MSAGARAGPPRRYSPLWQLILARLREFYREPEAIFWVYGFPILLVIALGIAFRDKPVERITVDVQQGPGAAVVARILARASRADDLAFVVKVLPDEQCRRRLRTGKTDLLVVVTAGPGYRYSYDRTRAEGRLARAAVNEVLQRAAGRQDRAQLLPDRAVQAPGGRYIDFLIPGLLGMSLMGGGLWGVGYVIVDIRIRKLLKRFLATPMRKSHFLAGIMLSRMIFMLPELLVLLLFSRLVFGVVIYGSLLAVLALIVLGAFTFAAIGLLVACRARTMETASGLMNLVMLPMWVLSGIFFSSDRFPDVLQPVIKVLPLTALIDALRAVMLEGAPLAAQLPRLALLAGWSVVTFVLALRLFRWS